MAEPKTPKKKRDHSKLWLAVQVSLFWVILAGVIILVQSVDKNAYTRGMQDGYSRAVSTLKK